MRRRSLVLASFALLSSTFCSYAADLTLLEPDQANEAPRNVLAFTGLDVVSSLDPDNPVHGTAVGVRWA